MKTESSAQLSEKYDNWHRELRSVSGDAPLIASWHHSAIALAPALQGAAVLEVGCGQGDFARSIVSQAKSVAAIDFSAGAIAIARQRQQASVEKIDYRVGDAQALEFPDASFDVVFSCECLEHVPDPQKALKEMARVLKPGGSLVLTTENYSNAMIVYWIMAWVQRRPFDSGAGVQPYENFFLFWNVKRMMRASGLEVVRMLGTHHVFLAVPGCHPHRFVREQFKSPFWARLFQPFARHMAYFAIRQ